MGLFFLPAAAVWVACFNVPAAVPEGGDAGSPSQSENDGGKTADAGDGGTVPFCSSQVPAPTFCDDFDDYSSTGTPTFNKWDPASGANTGGVLALETVLTVSPPNALEAQGTVPAAGINSEEDLVKSYSQFDTKPITLDAKFAFNVQDLDTTSGASIIAFELIFDQPGGFHQIVLNIVSLGDGTISARMAQNEDFDGGTPYAPYSFSDSPLTKQWNQIEVTIDIVSPTGTAGNTVSVILNKQTELDAEPLTVPLIGGVPRVHLGLGSVNSGNAQAGVGWSVVYDNFAMNLTSTAGDD
jgi:hypothetical protein